MSTSPQRAGRGDGRVGLCPGLEHRERLAIVEERLPETVESVGAELVGRWPTPHAWSSWTSVPDLSTTSERVPGLDVEACWRQESVEALRSFVACASIPAGCADAAGAEARVSTARAAAPASRKVAVICSSVPCRRARRLASPPLEAPLREPSRRHHLVVGSLVALLLLQPVARTGRRARPSPRSSGSPRAAATSWSPSAGASSPRAPRGRRRRRRGGRRLETTAATTATSRWCGRGGRPGGGRRRPPRRCPDRQGGQEAGDDERSHAHGWLLYRNELAASRKLTSAAPCGWECERWRLAAPRRASRRVLHHEVAAAAVLDST